MARPAVAIQRAGPVARVLLDRPPLHVLDFELIAALDSALASLEAERTVRVIVLGSAGDRAFSAGVDVKVHTPDLVPRMLREFHALIRTILHSPAVTIAEVNGAAFGGGFELMLACDLAVASDDATFGVPEIKLACFPPVALAMLPALVGRARASEIVLGGETFGALVAQAMGLVNRVVPRADVEKTTETLAKAFLAHSPSVLGLVTKELRRRALPDVEAAIEACERTYLSELLPLPDCTEGVRAFLEKRPPRWQAT